ncbi:MAG: hypothetical protein ACP5IG_02500 [Candidatus Micrarchaeia archaeon]|jgi:putative Mn2+ efflux pump MntP
MLGDLIIFGLAGLAVSSGIAQKYAKYCKAIGGAIMVFLGVLLLFAAPAEVIKTRVLRGVLFP